MENLKILNSKEIEKHIKNYTNATIENIQNLFRKYNLNDENSQYYENILNLYRKKYPELFI